jgi:acyl-CoA synthetase (NDP forming)/N-acetylglutamate synthase-like GNAT family acetyltransferase
VTDGRRISAVLDHDALTVSGRVVHVRQATPDDQVALADLLRRASPQSRYLRFFTAAVNLDTEVARLTRPGDDHLALLASLAGTVIGVASYERVDSRTADFAVLVDDAWQSEGIGTLLLEYTASAARSAGIETMVGDVLATNALMLEVAGALSPHWTRRHTDDPDVLQIAIPTRLDEAALAAVGLRDRTAEHRSLRPLLAPASVAVIGASRHPGRIGHEVVRALDEGGFPGPVYPVNPRADQVAGRQAYPTLAKVPSPVDLAVLCVPPSAVDRALHDCIDASVGAAVIMTAGFGEWGPEGASRQRELVRLARRHGLRLVGPNCLGVLNTDPRISLNATFATTRPQPGPLAIASQSGAVGVAVLQAAADSGVGVSTFVSLGNKADVSTNDLLAYWYDDPATQAVALYVESFGNPRRFAWLAQVLSRRKPVLAVKSGRSGGGQRAGASHTAAAAVPDVSVDALFRQAGVLRVDTLGELLDAVRVLTYPPLPEGRRIGIVGNAGGLNVLAADAADGADLRVVELSAPVRTALSGAPHPAGVGNPVDLGADAPPPVLADGLRTVASSGEVDLVLVTFVATRTNEVTASLRAMADVADEVILPVAVVVVGAPAAPFLGRRRVPVFTRPEDAVQALGLACRYADWRRLPPGRVPSLTGVDRHRARALVEAALADDGGWQPADVASALLGCYGVRVVETRAANDLDGALNAAAATGYPVALKAAVPGLVHKTERDGVQLDLAGPEEVRAGYRRLAAGVGLASPPVVVQPMVSSTVELTAGLVHDPAFGSLVVLGLGGTQTEVLRDRSVRMLPVTDRDAAAMWRELRAAPLLTGYRGAAPVDTAAVEDQVLRLAELAEDLPDVAELDLNPVATGPWGTSALDVKLRLARTGAEPDPYTRSLSR